MILAALRDPRARRPLRWAAAACWLAIAVLSLVPGEDRPHTGLSGNVEHLMAYALAAVVTRLAFQRTESRRQVLALSAAAALFEIAQVWIPGRSSGWTIGPPAPWARCWASSSPGPWRMRPVPAE